MKELTSLFMLFAFIACRGQTHQTIHLHITNRSSHQIDSILIPYNNIKLSEVGIGKTAKVELNISTALRSTDEGAFPLYIFQNGRKINTNWGFHDWGTFAAANEFIYLFDNGVSAKDENLPKPQKFILHIGDNTSTKIDSVTVEPGILEKQYIRSRGIELILDFEKFQRDPIIKIHQQEKLFVARIAHDWKDWNNTQEIVYIYDTGKAVN